MNVADISPAIAILPEIDARFLALRAEGLTVAAIAKRLERGEAWVKKRPAILAARGVAVPPVAMGRPTLDPAAATKLRPARLRPSGASTKPKVSRPRPVAPVAAAPECPTVARQPETTVEPLGVNLFALQRGQCRWPLDLASPGVATRFCGAPAEETYCPCHRARAWVGPGRTLDHLAGKYR